jgi:hypothetical protein
LPADAGALLKEVSMQFVVNPHQQLSMSNNASDERMRGWVIAALNAGGVATYGLNDIQLLARYDEYLQTNAKAVVPQGGAGDLDEGELLRLITEVQSLVRGAQPETMKKLGVENLKSIKKLLTPTANSRHGPFEGYDLNSFLEEAARG